MFIYVQTVFEGFQRNSFAAGLEDLEKHGVKGIYAFDAANPTAKKPSSIMKNYQTRGTPWSIVIDREGVVRMSQFTSKTDLGGISRVVDSALGPGEKKKEKKKD